MWELEPMWRGWVGGGCGGVGGAVTVVLSIASGGGAARGVGVRAWLLSVSVCVRARVCVVLLNVRAYECVYAWVWLLHCC